MHFLPTRLTVQDARFVKLNLRLHKKPLQWAKRSVCLYFNDQNNRLFYFKYIFSWFLFFNQLTFGHREVLM